MLSDRLRLLLFLVDSTIPLKGKRQFRTMQKQLKELSLHPTDPSIRSLRRDITVLALISLLQIATSLIFQLLSTFVTKVDYSVPASFQRLAPYLLSALEVVSYFFILFLPIFLISVFLKYPLPYKKIRLKPVLPPYTCLLYTSRCV